jgi:hypothetical protein
VDSKGNTYVGGIVEFPAPKYTGGASIFRQVVEKIWNWPAECRNRNSGGRDCFIEEYDIHGKRVWSLQPSTPVEDYIRDMTTDNNGNLYATVAVYNNSVETYSVNKYNAQGRPLWHKILGPSAGITTDSKGHIYLLRSHPNPHGIGRVDVDIVKLTERGAEIPSNELEATHYEVHLRGLR